MVFLFLVSVLFSLFCVCRRSPSIHCECLAPVYASIRSTLLRYILSEADLFFLLWVIMQRKIPNYTNLINILSTWNVLSCSLVWIAETVHLKSCCFRCTAYHVNSCTRAIVDLYDLSTCLSFTQKYTLTRRIQSTENSRK